MNSNLKYIRCSLPIIPSTQKQIDELNCSFGLNIEPFTNLNKFEMNPIKLYYSRNNNKLRYILKCNYCRTFVNKYFVFLKAYNNKCSNQNYYLKYYYYCNICNSKNTIDTTNCQSTILIDIYYNSINKLIDMNQLNSLQQRLFKEVKLKISANNKSLFDLLISDSYINIQEYYFYPFNTTDYILDKQIITKSNFKTIYLFGIDYTNQSEKYGVFSYVNYLLF